MVEPIDPRANLYLDPTVVARPLIGRCYAWPHLIPPASAAMHLSKRHLVLFESYLRSPRIHLAACRARQAARGSFLDVPLEQANEVAALVDEMRTRQADALELAEAIEALDELLATKADGSDAGPLHAEVPDPLRGLVELVYDRGGHAQWRLCERLLYRSRFYAPGQQGWSLARLTRDDTRFALVDPLLPMPGSVELRLAFAHPGVDRMFAARTSGTRWSELEQVLREPFVDAVGRVTTPEVPVALRSLLTPEAPPAAIPAPGEGLRIRYVGHACVLVESPTVTILIDPLVPSPLLGSQAEPGTRLSFAELPARIDAALITHMHADHLHLETLLQLRGRIDRIVVPRTRGGSLEDPDPALMLRTLGFPRVDELEPFAEWPLPGAAGRVVGLPFLGEHGSLDISSKLAYLVELGGQRLGFFADAHNLDGAAYRAAHAAYGPIDTLFIGMECEGAPVSWLYGPVLRGAIPATQDDSRRLRGSNAGEALSLIEILGAREVLVYAMGLEPWMELLTGCTYGPDSPPIKASSELIRACHRRGVAARRLEGSETWSVP